MSLFSWFRSKEDIEKSKVDDIVVKPAFINTDEYSTKSNPIPTYHSIMDNLVESEIRRLIDTYVDETASSDEMIIQTKQAREEFGPTVSDKMIGLIRDKYPKANIKYSLYNPTRVELPKCAHISVFLEALATKQVEDVYTNE